MRGCEYVLAKNISGCRPKIIIRSQDWEKELLFGITYSQSFDANMTSKTHYVHHMFSKPERNPVPWLSHLWLPHMYGYRIFAKIDRLIASLEWTSGLDIVE